MEEIAIDRRRSGRRGARGGGRRVTDTPAGTAGVPACPACRAVNQSALAGEADGGWWFVCLACDHLWDQRRVMPLRGAR